MSWRGLEPLLRSVNAKEAGFLIERIRQVVQAPDKERRQTALAILADALRSQSRIIGPLLSHLAGMELTAARRLAVELAARLPVDPSLIPTFLPLLRLKKIPPSVRLRTAAALIVAQPTGEDVSRILQAITDGVPSQRACDRLRYLKRRAPTVPAVLEMAQKIEARLAMTCPRCGMKLARPEMVKHLWQEHRLMLEGQRVREPWHVIRGWLTEFAGGGTPDLLDRCCEMAQQLDPENGLVRVHRELLQIGVHDEDALESLRELARHQQGTLCPHCYATVPGQDEPPLTPLPISRGRLAARGYCVAVSDDGLRPKLELSTPERVWYQDREPGQDWTRRGEQLLQVGPLVVLALLLALILPSHLGVPWPVLGCVLCLLVAVLLDGYSRWRHANVTPPVDRAIDHAWTLMVPRLHANGFHLQDSAFLGSLALTSLDHGRADLREKYLVQAVQQTRPVVAEGLAPASHLAALCRLQIADFRRRHLDAVKVLADLASLGLTGSLPLRYSELLLDPTELVRLSPGDRSRLRILLADRAFQAGLEVRDLCEIALIAPLLGEALQVSDERSLAMLKLIWTLRPTRAWQRCGYATTVFDLARYPAMGGQYLQARPTLLLFQPTVDSPREGTSAASAPVLVCSDGLVFHDLMIDSPNDTIEVKNRAFWQGGGFELTFGPHRLLFSSDPTGLAERLKRWSEYYFDEFLPQVEGVLNWSSPERLAPLLAQKTLECPECHRQLLRRTGDVGIPIPEPVAMSEAMKPS